MNAALLLMMSLLQQTEPTEPPPAPTKVYACYETQTYRPIATIVMYKTGDEPGSADSYNQSHRSNGIGKLYLTGSKTPILGGWMEELKFTRITYLRFKFKQTVPEDSLFTAYEVSMSDFSTSLGAEPLGTLTTPSGPRLVGQTYHIKCH